MAERERKERRETWTRRRCSPPRWKKFFRKVNGADRLALNVYEAEIRNRKQRRKRSLESEKGRTDKVYSLPTNIKYCNTVQHE